MTAGDDFEIWRRTLGASPRALLKVYPSLDHLFVEGQGLSTPQQYLQPNHVHKQVIEDIASWINALPPAPR